MLRLCDDNGLSEKGITVAELDDELSAVNAGNKLLFSGMLGESVDVVVVLDHAAAAAYSKYAFVVVAALGPDGEMSCCGIVG